VDHQVKNHKTIARFVAVLGILPGVWFLIATKTQFGGVLQITCGYWMVALVLLTIVWVMYAILTKILMHNIAVAHTHANSLNEARHYKLLFASTIIETTIASAIVVLSLLGFLVTDLQCYLSRI
jgi:hypothetical protein